MFGIGIIGCGLIGNKRANSLGTKGKLLICADINFEKAKELASEFEAIPTSNYEEVLSMREIDIVIISTLHDSLSEITKAAICAGKHVLVEKPGGRSSLEIKNLLKKTKNTNLKIRIGFNHRYHPAIIKANAQIENRRRCGRTKYILAF